MINLLFGMRRHNHKSITHSNPHELKVGVIIVAQNAPYSYGGQSFTKVKSVVICQQKQEH